MIRRWTSIIACLSLSILAAGCGSDPSEPIAPPHNPTVVFEYEHPFPVAGLSEMWGTASNNIFAVGEYGDVQHFDGVAWKSMTNMQRPLLLDVWGTASNNIVAVGVDGTILRFNGSTWNEEASGTQVELLGVWGYAPGTFYAVGRSGTALFNNGTGWKGLPLPTAADLLTVWGSGSNDIYIGASDALWHYDGNTWAAIGVQVRVRVLDIWGSSSNDVWVADGTNSLWHYDGNTWQDAPTSLPEALTNLWGFADNDIFGVGDGGMVAHFDGAKWTDDVVGEYTLTGVWGTAGNDVWACGTDDVAGSGGLFHFDGSNWTQTGQSLSGGQLQDIWSDATAERAWAVGGATIMQKENGEWKLSPTTPPRNLSAVWAAPTGEVFAVGSNSLCFFFDGATWQDIGPTQIVLQFVDVWGTSKDNVYAASNNGLWHFNGTDWDLPSSFDYINAVWGTDESNVFSAGFTTNSHGIVRHFDGIEWKTIYDILYVSVWDITGIGPEDVLAYTTVTNTGNDNLVEWDGTAWHTVTPPQVSRIDAIGGSAQFGFVTTGRNGPAGAPQTLLRRTDDGWEPLSPPYGANYRSIFGGLNNGVYLVGGNQIVQCAVR